MKRETSYFDDVELATSHIIEQVGSHIVLGAPLGLGKPNRLLNTIYSRVKSAPKQLSLKLYTALSLQVPTARPGLEKRFLEPFNARHFGSDYPHLNYLSDISSRKLPVNIIVHEFYFNPGSQLGNSTAQRNYICQNYTHVARDLVSAGINLFIQQVAKRGDRYSLSSNSDVLLDIAVRMDQLEKPFYVVGVVNSEMPFVGGAAEVDASTFDLVVDDGQSQRLYGIPREAVGKAEHAIGLFASSLVKDGGTLQIGIGALSDALVNGLIARHQDNTEYRTVL
ncbi:MAG: hypothetical protein L3J46_08000, partial [Kangiellaceae bacterium]|nr:hypothetical protein [Kangiellaceae bacterium]